MEANIQHKAIAAAAGAGKTYQLVTRYIALLAAGVPAERIIALTFSRKAAGEMFDRVVAALARAAASESAASDLGTRLCESGMSLPRHAVDRHSVCDLLRHLL
ncbi:MAG: UvrD-helicase domain-containing protein, partial [Candidatus Pacebacteria bacterium]|nr:UvrD-helicase domain-containing protein [Candidatus Paceibacterota bacterium]